MPDDDLRPGADPKKPDDRSTSLPASEEDTDLIDETDQPHPDISWPGQVAPPPG